MSNSQAPQGVKQIGRIVNGLRLVAGETKPTPKRAERVDELLRRALDASRGRLGRHIHVETRFEPDCVAIVNKNEITQVFMSLILNAAQAMADRSNGRLLIAARTQGESVIVDVQDTGGGIPVGLRDRLFAPFATDKPGHTGLGLSISHMIVQAHGGDITYTSQPDQGTTFHVRLARAQLSSDMIRRDHPQAA